MASEAQVLGRARACFEGLCEDAGLLPGWATAVTIRVDRSGGVEVDFAVTMRERPPAAVSEPPAVAGSRAQWPPPMTREVLERLAARGVESVNATRAQASAYLADIQRQCEAAAAPEQPPPVFTPVNLEAAPLEYPGPVAGIADVQPDAVRQSE